jgi:ribulose 1,5-bisphosphate synthetase/thiazole synthase
MVVVHGNMFSMVVQESSRSMEVGDFDRQAVAHLVLPKYDVAVIGAGVSGLQAAQVSGIGLNCIASASISVNLAH